MPDASVFIDSTTFLYTLDAEAVDKAEVAQDWLLALTLGSVGNTNLQVLNEVANVLTRKPARFEKCDPFERVDVFSFFGKSPLNFETTVTARTLFVRYHYSWWDCLLLASALELGCTHFLSEDLQGGQKIEDDGEALTIIDPFAHSPDQILLSR